MDFADKVAVVTGAGRGIGRAIALTLARGGASLVLINISDDDIDAVTKEIEALGRPALGLKCDISQKSAVENAAKKTMARFHKVDILVNTAGARQVAGAKAGLAHVLGAGGNCAITILKK